MKAVLVTAFMNYEARLSLAKEALEACGITRLVLTTDFDHMKKTRRASVPEGFNALCTRPYAKNISFSRILSHRDFARKAAQRIECLAPDVIYAVVPPNSLIKELAHYKTQHPNVKLIFDLCDLWPEALPRPLLKALFFPVFWAWRHLRDAYLPKADLVITECELFCQKAHLKNAKTVYWCAKDDGVFPAPNIKTDTVELAYLGSINHILDIERTARFVGEVARLRPVCVHVIGTGERKEDFLLALRKAGADVIDHGFLYDEAKKAQIFSHCRYGLNILKEGIAVGLSMKSIDYLKAGLPLINSLAGDTAHFVREARVGVNLSDGAPCRVLQESLPDLFAARKRARTLFETTFSVRAVKKKMTLILKEFLAGGLEHLFGFRIFSPFPVPSLALH